MMLFIIVCLLILSILTTYLTNPFVRFTVVRLPYRAKLEHSVITAIDNNHKLRVHKGPLWKLFAVYQSGLYVLTTRYLHSPRSRASTENGIIRDIHQLRYDPTRLLLISGDHFNSLFVRNLGVFYYPMLDTAIGGTRQDWHNRQMVYLQSVAYALGVFSKHQTLTTTIVATGPYSATCVNFYAYPSDSLFGIIYALAALSGIESARPAPYKKAVHSLASQKAAQLLIKTYRETLLRLYADYRQYVYDEQTGLIKLNVHLSGAKDITKRRSAFYDNVIFWKTTQLYMRLGLMTDDKPYLSKLKRRILQTYWLDQEGYFLEDQSPEAIAGKFYSSDWLIVLSTGFLDPAKPHERQYYERAIAHIQKTGVDQPFALKYHADRRANRQFLAVRLTVATYGGDSIWSFWGMEYIKSLLLLYKHTGKTAHLKAARYHLNKYRQAILREGGFPEVYDKQGTLLKTAFYKSIRQTGWVIGYEQARAMYDAFTE